MNKSFFRLIVLLLMVVGISGCSSLRGITYIPPQSGPTAKIKFINKTKGELKVEFFEISKNCERRRFLSPLLAGEESAFIPIYAEKEFTLEHGIAFANSSQYVHEFFRFTPKESAEYILESNQSQNASSVNYVFQEKIENQPASNIQINKLDWKPGSPWDENGKFCRED